MDTTADKVLNIGYLNCRAQTGFNESKQLQIENFLKMYSLDILHLQETHIEENTFSQCSFILSNYEIIHNNSPTKYGTSSLIRSSLAPRKYYPTSFWSYYPLQYWSNNIWKCLSAIWYQCNKQSQQGDLLWGDHTQPDGELHGQWGDRRGLEQHHHSR